MKEGFTLVELIAVITILSIILSVAAVSTNYFSNQRKQKDYDNIVDIIEENTNVFINTNNDIFVKVNNKLSNLDKCKINYKELIDNNLIDKDTINPKTNNTINIDSYIKITVQSDYDFKYEFIDKDLNNTEEIQDCLN